MITDKIEQIFLDTPKKDRARIEKARKAAIEEIVARYLPGIELRYWSPKGGRVFGRSAPAISRIYLNRDGEKLGFVGVRRTGRRPSGYYENHRRSRGEEQYATAFETDLPEDVRAALRAAVTEYLTRTGGLPRFDDVDQFEFTYGRLIYTRPIG